MSVLFIHYEVAPETLQSAVPYALDLRAGRAYLSVVAFSQERLQFAFGGRLTAWVGALAANHDFLNVRTYVRVGNQRGIYFIGEWVPNRLALWLGPRLFGLPYRYGQFRSAAGELIGGEVRGSGGRFRYRLAIQTPANFRVCEPGSLDEFLLERYVAFTDYRGRRRCFHVAHEPWAQQSVPVLVEDDSLARSTWSWWPAARLVGANFSPGVTEVQIGRPQRIAASNHAPGAAAPPAPPAHPPLSR